MDFGKCLRCYGPFEIWIRESAGSLFWAINIYDKLWRGGSRTGATTAETLAEAQEALAEILAQTQLHLIKDLVRR